MADEVVRRPGEWEGEHRTRAATVRGARTATAKADKASRMQAGYDVYTSSTGRSVGTGVAAKDVQSRADYHRWATSDEGKAAWKNRAKPKPKPANTAGRTAQEAGDALAKADKE